MKEIYLDYAAATPLDVRVEKEMRPYWREIYGNPRSIHAMGNTAKNALTKARKEVARFLGAKEYEIVFTSGGTEGNSLATIGIIRALKESRKKIHVVTTAIEHSSVHEPLRALEKEGVEVSFVPVLSSGIIDLTAFSKALKKETALISIMHVNNETGAVQPLSSIVKIIKEHKKKNNTSLPYFHVDASQSSRYLPVNVFTMGVEALTLDGQKIYGPKGVGALYVKSGTPLRPLFFGGGQEYGLRAGTQNVPGAIGFAKALAICGEERKKEEQHLKELRSVFLDALSKEDVSFVVNGDAKKTIPGILNLSFPGYSGEQLLIALEEKKIYVTTTSACATGSNDPSYVLLAMNGDARHAQSALRFSFGRETKKKDLQYVAKVIKTATSALSKKTGK